MPVDFCHNVLKPWELEGPLLLLCFLGSPLVLLGPSWWPLVVVHCFCFFFSFEASYPCQFFHHVLKPWELEGLSGSLVLSWVSSGAAGSSLVASCGCPLFLLFLFL